LIDSSALIHRSYHAIPELTTKDGTPVNAVYGFSTTLIKFLKDFKPDYVLASFDEDGETFRHEIVESYKANRLEAPEDLKIQFPIVRKIVDSFGFKSASKKGYEADDIIGSVVEKFKNKDNLKIIILTGDNDLLQLVSNDKVLVFTFGRNFSLGTLYNEKKVIEKYGFPPSLIADYKALKGDESDNIKGVHGIGEKTATELVKKFGSVEKLYKAIKEGDEKILGIKDKVFNILKNGEKDCLESKALAQIERNLEVQYEIDDLVPNFDPENLRKVFTDLSFSSLIKRIPEINFLQSKKTYANKINNLESDKSTKMNKNKDFEILVASKENWKEVLKIIEDSRSFAFDTETDSLNPQKANLVGLSFATSENFGIYIPFRHKNYNNLEIEKVLELQEAFSSKNLKIAHNIKYDIHVLKNYGVKVSKPFYDTMIAEFLITCGQSQSLSLDFLVEKYFQKKKIYFEELFSNKDEKNFSDLDVEIASEYSVEDSIYTFRIWKKLSTILENEQKNLGRIFDLEMNTVPVLVDMERNGFLVDEKKAREISEKLKLMQLQIKSKVESLTGEKINLNSPKEVSNLLFNKLKLPTLGIKKTTLGYSTSEDSLLELRNQSQVVREILKYREIEKMINTYLEKIPAMQDEDRRVRTNFSQTQVATGRITSSNPNLQAIPKRTNLGKKVRSIFVADRNFKILSIDFSQIELRVLAEISKDENLTSSFEKNSDIHKITAATIFGKNEQDVTEEERDIGKTINFSIIYGVSPFGLSKSLDVEIEIASIFIESFFQKFPKVKLWINETIKSAYEKSFVKTALGRKIFIPFLKSPNLSTRKQGERQAVNYPIQGTASEILKIGMVKIDEFLRSEKMKTKILSQIHDEIILEINNEEIGYIDKLKGIFSSAPEEIFGKKFPVEHKISDSL